MSSFDYGVGSVIYPGIKQIVSASYSRSHGITPDVCTIEMAPQSLNPKDSDYTAIEPDGYLLFQFDEYTNDARTGTTQILMQGCRPDKASVRRSASSETWTIPIYDRRWKWKFGSFSGHWNVKKNGAIEPRKEKTPRELADMCLEAMGELRYETKALDDLEKLKSLPYRKQVRPEVHWDRIPPAQALNELVTPLGYRVCLGWDEVVRIEKYGEGALLPTEDLMSGGFDAELPETPDSVTVLGGISMHEALWELEAVGLDIDGEWRPIEHLSYCPRNDIGERDWKQSVPPHFGGIKAKFDEIKYNKKPTDEEYRKRKEQYALAVQTIYRCYRLKYPAGTKEKANLRKKYDRLGDRLADLVNSGFRQGDNQYDDMRSDYEAIRRELFLKSEPILPGPKKIDRRTGRKGDYKLEEFEQVLPCFETRAELSVDSYTGKLSRKPAEVKGIYYDTGKVANTESPNDPVQIVSTDRFQILSEWGIVKFNTPMVRYFKSSIDNFDGKTLTSSVTTPADLRILIATPLKNLVGEPARYEHREELSNRYRTKPAKLPGGVRIRKLPGGTDTKVVIKKEIVQAYQARYDLSTNSNGDVKVKILGVAENTESENLKEQALSAIAAENLKIFTKDSGSGIYAGLKKIGLDGAIQQVAISRTKSGGMTTTIARNSEVSVFVPSFDERQRNIALKEMIKNHNETIDTTDKPEVKDV